MMFPDSAPESTADMRIDALIANRHSLDLSYVDIVIFQYLVWRSRKRIHIHLSVIRLAEKLGINETTVYKTIQKLREIDLIRKSDYSGRTSFIVTPTIINNGTRKQKMFKVKLWEKAIQSKRKKQGIVLASTPEKNIHDLHS
jgi:predicted transcriptional regulator